MAEDQDPDITEHPELPPAEGEAPPEGLPQLVTEIHTIEEQVGRHVITALRHNGTVAVLTAVLPGPSGERIASVPLNAELWMKVQELLAEVGEEHAQDVPCVGFQCVLRDRAQEAKRKRLETPPDNM